MNTFYKDLKTETERLDPSTHSVAAKETHDMPDALALLFPKVIKSMPSAFLNEVEGTDKREYTLSDCTVTDSMGGEYTVDTVFTQDGDDESMLLCIKIKRKHCVPNDAFMAAHLEHFKTALNRLYDCRAVITEHKSLFPMFVDHQFWVKLTPLP